MAVWDLLTPSTSQSTCGNVDEGDFVGAAMAVWDLLTPSTSQGACGNVDEGDFVGAAMAVWDLDRKSTRLNSSHRIASRMPSSA